MKTQVLLWVWCGVMWTSVVGCDVKFTKSNTTTGKKAGEGKLAGVSGLGGSADQGAVLPGSTPESERVTAGVGVAKKGRRLDQDHVVQEIAQPAKTLFATNERMVFDIAIPKAMQLYKATNGHFPKSHEQFMEQIIKTNQIKLPELPAGHRYVYDPERGELMVERPSS